MMLITVVVVALAVVTSSVESASTEKRDGRSCSYGGEEYESGSIFKSGWCAKRICEDGKDTPFWEACIDSRGYCREEGVTWDEECITKTCERRGNSYHVATVNAGCQDRNGKCRAKGETFSFEIDGVTYETCICYSDGKTGAISCYNEEIAK